LQLGLSNSLSLPCTPDPTKGNIRRAEHFLGFMRRFIAHLADVMRAQVATEESPTTFLNKVQEAVRVDAKTLRWVGGLAGWLVGWF
jgi:hypothetical protein